MRQQVRGEKRTGKEERDGTGKEKEHRRAQLQAQISLESEMFVR